MKKVHYSIVVSGKVQGVWFRKHTKNKADALGIKGFVKNERNGSVYIAAEGYTAVLQEFINWLHTGSPLSKVSNVSFDVDATLKGYSEFSIRRDV